MCIRDRSSTATFSAGARSHPTNRETFSTVASSTATPSGSRNCNHSFRLVAYVRSVVGDLSNACRCARNASTSPTGSPPPSSTVHDSDSSGISTRCTRILTSLKRYTTSTIGVSYDSPAQTRSGREHTRRLPTGPPAERPNMKDTIKRMRPRQPCRRKEATSRTRPEGYREGALWRLRAGTAYDGESDGTVIVEGNHYFPPDSVQWTHLTLPTKRIV